jgi:2-succinyl-5-enolpyruvyl-6-hydroxy-3-cyclohexene-1-carboxylate synthase
MADGLTKGVVHINLPFRKPLEPTPDEAMQHAFTREARPFTRVTHGQLLPTELDVSELARLIAMHERGVIVCGPRCEGAEFPRSVARLSERSGYPIFADALSGLRFGNPDVISCYDTFLNRAGGSMAFTPDVVIRFGAVPTSAVLCDALSRSGAAHRIHVVQDGSWADDDHRTTWLLQADPTATCDALTPCLGSRGPTEWSSRLHRFEHDARTKLQEALNTSEWFDGAAVHELLQALPEGARLFAGNSLPIRHVDEFGFARQTCLSVFGSRGASGIDGNISTALGIAAADPTAPCVALVGDITLYHDMNGLLAIRRLGLDNATIIALNNNGGGIFHRLPVAGLEPAFTQLFLTPHDLNFEHAAALYGLNYARVKDREEMRACLHARFTDQVGSAQFIEVPTDARRDLAQRKAIGELVLERIK